MVNTRSLKGIIKRLLPAFLLRRIVRARNRRLLKDWEKAGRPVPVPQIVKQMAVSKQQQRSAIRILIETGTYLGDMVEAQKSAFDRIISIELSEALCRDAGKRFRFDRHVTIVQGDSGEVLGPILRDIHEPVIFWLDGHYSGGVTAKGATACPVFKELEAIFAHPVKGHVLLIDDARLFNGTGDYPTIEELRAFVQRNAPACEISVKDDIIRCRC